MLDTEVYAKTDAGRDEIRARTKGLSMAARAILLMVDGQRTVGAMRALIAGSKAPADVLETLAEQGLIEPRGGAVPIPPAVTPPAVTPPVAPVVAAPPPAPPTIDPHVADPPRGMDLPSPRSFPPAGRSLADAPLDLELPTIYGPETDPPPAQAAPSFAPPVTPPFASGAPAQNRYERLYAMMNEIVRDFLAPHRRYFFQLKIERCTTAEELIDLLQGLQATLAKARGEAFASEVISRLRSAAT